ncbi:MAG: histidine kinase [Aeromicrobium sp.]
MRSAVVPSRSDEGVDGARCIALELELRRTQQLVAVTEDRYRIAQDLHKTVLQQLFITGMGLQATMADPAAPAALRSRISDAVDLLDATTEDLRVQIAPWHSAPGG